MFNDNWSAEDKRHALAHLRVLECYEFIYCVVTMSRYCILRVAKIQGVDQDIVSGVCSAMESCGELESKHVMLIVSPSIYLIIVEQLKFLEYLSLCHMLPCIRNTEETLKHYFKKSVTLPFLDDLISMSSRFTTHTKHAASLQNLVPTKFLLTLMWKV